MYGLLSLQDFDKLVDAYHVDVGKWCLFENIIVMVFCNDIVYRGDRPDCDFVTLLFVTLLFFPIFFVPGQRKNGGGRKENRKSLYNYIIYILLILYIYIIIYIKSLVPSLRKLKTACLILI